MAKNKKIEKQMISPAAKPKSGVADEVKNIFDSALVFFNFGKIKDNTNKIKQNTDLKKAIMIFLLAAITVSLISIAVTIISTYFTAYSYKNLAEKTGIVEPIIDWSSLGPFIVFTIAFVIPAAFVGGIIYELLVYGLVKLTGGKGTLPEHLYVSSAVAFAISISSALLLLTPIPCVNLFVVLAYLFVIPAYFLFVVKPKSYQEVHRISYLHALGIIILVSIVWLLVMLAVLPTIMNFFNLPSVGRMI
ncbi:hypothetical protein HY988_01745 [Candidatus Micrarchaeota archaeon]|nr:hypothetical protein [Candidatus Micrarchaeota archaeon]